MVPKPKAKGKVSARLGGAHATAKLWSLKSENIIRAGVFVVNIMGGLTAIETAKKMKGDANAVLTAAEKWREAALKLSDCENPLFLASNALQSDWSGPAYSAFDKLMGRNMQVAGGNAAALLGAEMALLDLSVQVTNTYNSAVDLTTLAASRIQPALGSASPAQRRTTSQASSQR
ncbi:hypothetical protein GCM10023195_85110 [Actinoallomurus liliacearum]|uniref:Phasin domain-containing protein n=1 Tax=Actinoallomurus liliacearum TaxID=1080073 RepID=A0ABP8TXH2_9ACTN